MKKIILFAVAAVLTASCTQTGKNGTVQQADERIDSLRVPVSLHRYARV